MLALATFSRREWRKKNMGRVRAGQYIYICLHVKIPWQLYLTCVTVRKEILKSALLRLSDCNRQTSSLSLTFWWTYNVFLPVSLILRSQLNSTWIYPASNADTISRVDVFFRIGRPVSGSTVFSSSKTSPCGRQWSMYSWTWIVKILVKMLILTAFQHNEKSNYHISGERNGSLNWNVVWRELWSCVHFRYYWEILRILVWSKWKTSSTTLQIWNIGIMMLSNIILLDNWQ